MAEACAYLCQHSASVGEFGEYIESTVGYMYRVIVYDVCTQEVPICRIALYYYYYYYYYHHHHHHHHYQNVLIKAMLWQRLQRNFI